MDGLKLFAGLLLPWLAGVAVLLAGLRVRASLAVPGEIAWIAGAGYLVGAFLLTLWMRALSLAGVHFGIFAIAAPLLAVTAVAGYCAWRRYGDALLRAVRDALRALVHPPGLEGAARLAWQLLIAWNALRFLLLGLHISWQPLFPWDAWIQWATKARVWYELGRVVPFARADAWFAAAGGAYFDASPGYPPTAPLLQVWACIALGRWDDALMNWPWWQIAAALAFAVYGALRALGMGALAALATAYVVASLPLANVHVALAGYADLPMAAFYTCAVLALLRWGATRDPRDAALVAVLAIACTQVKIPGIVWALTLAPGVIVALLPRLGPKLVLAGFGAAAMLARRPRADKHENPGLHAASRFRAGVGSARHNLFSARQLEPAVVRRDCRVVAGMASARIAGPRSDDGRRRGRGGLPGRGLQLHQRQRLGLRSDDRQSCDAPFRAGRCRICSAGIPRVRPPVGQRQRPGRRARRLTHRAGAIVMLDLPGVTLCCIDTRNHALALRALAISREGVRFARTLFITDALPPGVTAPDDIEIVPIHAIDSRDAYSEFVLKSLRSHIATAHVLLVQWDGYVVNPAAWDQAFIDCDYIGAPWYWHDDGMRVGNGGFSLRSKRLLDALQDPRIVLVEAEDATIGRTFRPLLERDHGIRFASEALASTFAFEAAHPIGRPFGFHGLFNFSRIVPADELTALVVHFTPTIARSPQLLQLGRNCLAMGMWRPAAAIFRRILDEMPGHPEAEVSLASAAANAAAPRTAGRNEPCPCGSGKRYKNCHGALTQNPTAGAPASLSIDARMRQALALHQKGDTAAAEAIYREVLSTAPDHPQAQHFLGVIHYQRRELDAALPLLERSVAAVPNEPEFHNNLGLALAAANREDEAIAAYRAALALKADHAVAWNNLGLALQSVNDVAGATAAFRRAIELTPEFAKAHWNLALALLLDGHFSEGWREYDWRLRLAELGKDRNVFPGPVWDGTAPAGKTVLIYAEQGLGDALQFARYLTLLADAGARCIVHCRAALRPLLATVRGVAQVVSDGEALPRYDARLALLSLPQIFGTTLRHDSRAGTVYRCAPGTACRSARAARHFSRHEGRPLLGWQRRESRQLVFTRHPECAIRRPGHRLVLAAAGGGGGGDHLDARSATNGSTSRRRTACRYRRADRGARSRDHHRHQHRAPGRGTGEAGVGDAAIRTGLAVVARPQRQSMVSDVAPVPAAAAARLDLGRRRPFRRVTDAPTIAAMIVLLRRAREPLHESHAAATEAFRAVCLVA